MQPLFLKSAPALTSRENIQILKDLSPELKKISIIIWQQEIWHSLCMSLLLEGMNIRPASKTHVCRKAVTKKRTEGKSCIFNKSLMTYFDISMKNFILKLGGGGGRRGRDANPISKYSLQGNPSSFVFSKDGWMSIKRQKVLSGLWPLWCFYRFKTKQLYWYDFKELSEAQNAVAIGINSRHPFENNRWHPRWLISQTGKCSLSLICK